MLIHKHPFESWLSVSVEHLDGVLESELGTSVEEPHLLPACVEDKNGHILPYVTFEGGRLELAEPALHNLRGIAERRR